MISSAEEYLIEDVDRQLVFPTRKKKCHSLIIMLVWSLKTELEFSDVANKGDLLILMAELMAKPLFPSKLLDIFEETYFLKQYTWTQILDLIKDILEIYEFQDLQFLSNSESTNLLRAQLIEKFHETDLTAVANFMPFINKADMKAKLKRIHGVKLPKYLLFEQLRVQQIDEIVEFLGFPILAKRLNGYGCRGVTLLHSTSELATWIKDRVAQNDFNYELDEFIPGIQYHSESIISEGQVRFFQAWRNSHPCLDYFSGKMSGSITLRHTSEEAIAMRRLHETVLKGFHRIPSGATHLEAIKSPNGNLVFLEIAARYPGCLNAECLLKHREYNIEKEHFKAQLKQPLSEPNSVLGPYAAWAMYPRKSGIITKINPLPILSNYQVKHCDQLGDTHKASETFEEFSMSLILYNTDYEVLEKDFEILCNFEPFVLN